jgi:hypothetical protein
MLVKPAIVTGHPYTVKEMAQRVFFEFKQVIKKGNWSNGNKIIWNKLKEFYVCT